MQKVSIETFEKICNIENYLKKNSIKEICIKKTIINEEKENIDFFNSVVLAFRTLDTLNPKIESKFLKFIFKEIETIEESYLCFYEKDEEKNETEEEIKEFLKKNKNEFINNLLNWNEYNIYFIKFKELPEITKKGLLEDFIEEYHFEENSHINLYKDKRKEQKLIENLREKKEKILKYLTGTYVLPEGNINDMLDIKYFISYYEKSNFIELANENDNQIKKDLLQNALKGSLYRKELLIDYLNTLDGKKYFSKSYFKQAFYLYIRYISLLREETTSKRIYLENQSNQSAALNIRIMVGTRKNNSYLEKLEMEGIDPVKIKLLKKLHGEYQSAKNKIKTEDTLDCKIEIIDFIKKLQNNYVIKGLNSPIFRVKIVPIFELENLENSKLYYIATKNTDYLGLYNKVLSELKNGSYIFENSEAKERIKIFDKEEIDEVGEVVGIYFN